jgi:hypothetical protein
MIKTGTYAILLVYIAANAVPCVADSGAANSALEQNHEVTFSILSPDDHQLIGNAIYKTEKRGASTLLLGKNQYKDGEHDLEREEIALKDGDISRMMSFEHDFFDRDGSVKLLARANTDSGQAVCVSYESGRKHEISKQLDFPSDTYVGAAAVALMETAFRQGREQVDFHTFDCTPAPSIIAVTAHRGEQDERWAVYPKPLVRVKLTAKLGWLGDVIGNLLPHRNAWFDPRNWQYVGGTIQRYLASGPQVILVRKESSLGDLLSSAR